MLDNPESVVVEPSCRTEVAGLPSQPGILVVDDNVVLRDLLARVLRSAGYQVWLAGELPQALDLYHRHQRAIRLLLLDVDLGADQDGPDVLAAIRQECPDILCCFVTGGSVRYSDEDLLTYGGQVVLSKPFQLSDLEQIVQTLLRCGSPTVPQANG